jgi:hypothetical protein
VTSSLLPSLYVCSSKSDCRLSVTSTKKKESEREGERETKKVLQRMSRKRERERRQGNDQKESSSGRHLFILHLHTIKKSFYFSPFLIFFLRSTLRESEKNHNEHQVTCKWY